MRGLKWFVLVAMLGFVLTLAGSSPASAQGSSVGPTGGSSASIARLPEGQAPGPQATPSFALPELRAGLRLALERFRYFGWAVGRDLGAGEPAVLPSRPRLTR